MKFEISQRLRDHVFYLLKKYTSYRLLHLSYLLYKEYVDTFEQQLRYPSDEILNATNEYDQERHETEFMAALSSLASNEDGLKLLLTSPYKHEAYKTFLGPSGVGLFGRYADEMGLYEDIFYQKLGLAEGNSNIYEPYLHTRFVEKYLISGEIYNLATTTFFDGEYSIPNKEKIFNKWSYESLFSASYWPLFKTFVEPIEHCPKNNLDTTDEVLSGENIFISGIYEPWFEHPVYENLTQDPDYNPYVGCPNYFLSGTQASQYKLEGGDRLYNVKWRLIWEDTRYLDHSVPKEEQEYVIDLKSVGVRGLQEGMERVERFSILAGQPCPVSGYWFTFAKENSRQYFKQGEIFPHLQSGWGDVYWQLEGDEPRPEKYS